MFGENSRFMFMCGKTKMVTKGLTIFYNTHTYLTRQTDIINNPQRASSNSNSKVLVE